ncbi:DUF5365 family protein [Bacillus sp. B1-b2]|uniref:DUF5365 family protein n=1 Tax=Bacillus sp. B1-b2 TaxID=2653201 RepID=UPI0012615F6F|nr:DUF5365 family protein [Bacillus sp. B1-b2]KAB7666889.1 hypothetical protein F9279_16645 [Bacillus sp. B1-b2]
MKVVFASTPTQEERINELIHTFYSKIFPYYFSDKEIRAFERLQVLAITPEVSSTLKTSYQVIASLQTLINILEDPDQKEDYQHLFEKNVQILEEFDLFFPFDLDNFMVNQGSNNKQGEFSMYIEADNQYLL